MTGIEIKYSQLFINNEFVNAENGKSFPTVNPVTEEVICQVQEASAADVDKAVAAAKAAFRFGSVWRTMDAAGRASLICRLADLVARDAEHLARLESLDNGKALKTSRQEVGIVCDILRYYAGWADKVTGKTLPTVGNYVSYTRREPVGVVGAILPWNAPLCLLAMKLAPALAAGCTIVVKPAEQTSLTTLHVAALVKEAGLPAGVVNVVAGFGQPTASAITHHRDVNKVSFTGSTDVGRIIMSAAAQSNLKRVVLELGGKSPLVIMDDANIDEAAFWAHEACMYNQGQCCIAATRTYVHAKVYDKFIECSKKLAENRKLGDPYHDDTVQGPQIDQRQLDKIIELVESGKKEGARLVAGGARHGSKGFFFQPTVFADVKDTMRIAKEEIFGPVQSIFKFESWDDVIERCNDSPYGLASGIFTKDIDKANMFAQAMEAGTVWINCFLIHSVATPAGGFKQSGIGREFGEEGILDYTEVKTVTMAVPQKNS